MITGESDEWKRLSSRYPQHAIHFGIYVIDFCKRTRIANYPF
jgi:hypothetical protein